MKRTIRLTESDINRIVKESVENILNEGVFDKIKSGAWKAKNLFPYGFNGVKGQVDVQNKKPYNPYTYNKNNFHEEYPEYGSKEQKNISNADDGDIANRLYGEIDIMRDILNGNTSIDNENTKFYIERAMGVRDEGYKYGLSKHAKYLDNLITKVLGKYKQETNKEPNFKSYY